MTPEREPSSPTVSTLKRLFARSGNRCAFPRCPNAIVHGETVVGEVCHIRGKRPGAPRHDPAQTSPQRHDYDNLILLCSSHHTIIDDDPEAYTIDRLRNMKTTHEERAVAIPDAEAEHAAGILISQSVASINQAGGITAHTVNITLSQPPISEEATRSTDTGSLEALEDYTFVSNGGEQIARTRSLDKDGRPNDFVYWHRGPTAWLRVIPSALKAYGRAELRQLVESALIPLGPFGSGSSTRIESNDRGVVTIGFDGNAPETIATRITQVFRTGQIWGHNKILIDPQPELTRTCRIPWPVIKQEFEHTLASYIQFAHQVLRLDLPVTIVAGLALVKDAEFVRDKLKWYADPPKITRCLDQFVWQSSSLPEFKSSPRQLLEPFYKAVFDACALNYSDEPRVHTWPR